MKRSPRHRLTKCSTRKRGSAKLRGYRFEALESREVLTAVPQAFPYFEGFETASVIADLPGWVVNDGGIGTVEITSTGIPLGGTKHLQMQAMAPGVQEAYFAIDLSTASDPSSWWLEFGARRTSLSNSSFSMQLSGDGVNWG